MKKEYVCGFLFSNDGSRILLIEKKRPKWQAGKLNGVGGKIDESESAIQAMKREFLEEAGLSIDNWTPFCVLEGCDSEYNSGGGKYIVHFFSSRSDTLRGAMTMTDENILIHRTNEVHLLNVVPNLKWLIPMAIEKGLVAKVFDGIK